jgi:hypothetical protein
MIQNKKHHRTGSKGTRQVILASCWPIDCQQGDLSATQNVQLHRFLARVRHTWELFLTTMRVPLLFWQVLSP